MQMIRYKFAKRLKKKK